MLIGYTIIKKLKAEYYYNPKTSYKETSIYVMKILVLLLFTLLVQTTCFAQYNQHYRQTPELNENLTISFGLAASSTSAKSHPWRQAFVTPLLFTVFGWRAEIDNDFLTDEETYRERHKHNPDFKHRVDDYIQYAPIVAVYGLDALGVKAKTDFANRTAILIKTELILAATVYPLKKITAVPRPNTGQPTSFPSGHTAQAFAAATFMAKEYGHHSVWYSIGAYSTAVLVGSMRILNDRHWLSDVFVGAAIGIFATNLAYLTHQYAWGKKKRMKATLIIPSYDGTTGMLSVVHRF